MRADPGCLCLSRVEVGSDAGAKGLRVGDRVLAIDGIEPRPADLFRLKSGSEIFAKLVQVRKRGLLLGERSGGHASVAQVYPLALGTARKFTAFGVSVTIAQVVMPDGTVIEGAGVTPDEVLIPTHEDLYLGRDKKSPTWEIYCRGSGFIPDIPQSRPRPGAGARPCPRRLLHHHRGSRKTLPAEED